MFETHCKGNYFILVRENCKGGKKAVCLEQIHIKNIFSKISCDTLFLHGLRVRIYQGKKNKFSSAG